MGTTQMFYALSTNQDYIKERVNLFIAFAPIVRFDHTSIFLKMGASMNGGIANLFYKEGIYSLFCNVMKSGMDNFFSNRASGILLKKISEDIGSIADPLSNPVNNVKWGKVGSRWSPAQASIKEIEHYGQIF